MHWVVTGYAGDSEGLLYVVNADTEEAAYQEVARTRKARYIKLERSKPKSDKVSSEGLDDEDEFDSGSPDVYDILIPHGAKAPTWEEFDEGENHWKRMFTLRASVVRIDANLVDAIQW